MPKTARHGHNSDPARDIRARSIAAVFLATMAVLSGTSGPSIAQSIFGCAELDQSPVPSVEGLSGTFFRIDPDLLMDTRIPAPTIDSLSEISRSLLARGTRLVYVPVPTKALVQPGSLGAEASNYGYDVRLARALHADSIVHLRSNGITTVDSVGALEDAASDAPAFFATDPRMTNAGLRRLARGTADEVGEAYVGGTIFRTTESEVQELLSHDRFLLQLSCQAELPKLRTRTYVTVPDTEGAPSAPVAVVGSTLTGGDDRNFAGFLSEALQRHVTHQSFATDAHAALARYLASPEFRNDRPDLIVWLVPIWENPARFGDQPLRELAAAAADDCGPGRAAERDQDGSYRFELDGVAVTAGHSLRIENGTTPVASAVFRFASPTGHERVRTVIRKEETDATPLVYMPLSGLWPKGAASVAVELDVPSETPPVISVCRG